MKIELEGQRHNFNPENAASHSDQRIFLACAALSGGQAIAIFALVLELEVIDRLQIGKQLRRPPVETQFEPTARPNAHVVVALRAYLCISFQIGLVEDRVAFHAFFPEPLRDAGAVSAFVFVDAGRQDFVNPTHGIPQRGNSRVYEGAVFL